MAKNKAVTHVERLREAGVLSRNKQHLAKRHEDQINALSRAEVDALCRVAKKVGHIKVPGHPAGRAWIL